MLRVTAAPRSGTETFAGFAAPNWEELEEGRVGPAAGPDARIVSAPRWQSASMAKRADARITEVRSSHVAMYSHPADVVKVILAAAASVQ